MRIWVILLLFLGVPLAEGTKTPSTEAELWADLGLDSQFIRRFVRNELCHKGDQWKAACTRASNTGLRFLTNTEANQMLKSEWLESQVAERPDFDRLVLRLENADTRVPKAMVWGYMANMVLATFDPHARLIPMDFFATVGTGPHNRVGIGVQFEIRDDRLIARRIFRESPAERAGIQVHDELVSVNGRPVQPGYLAYDALDRLEGEVGKEVRVELRRDAVVTEKTLKLEHLHTPDVELKFVDLFNRRHAVITIYNFSQGVCESAQQHLRTAMERNAAAVLLDLRFNIGGYNAEGFCVGRMFTGDRPLAGIRFFSESFLPDDLDLNPRVLDHQPSEEPLLIPDVQNKTIPLAVLVNSFTGSISEILTAALQDTERAWVVGTGTMGKGTFQLNAISTLHPRLWLRHTVGEAIRLSEGVIHHYGITPNFDVPFRRGEKGRPFYLFAEKAYVPYPIPPSRTYSWKETRAQRRLQMDRCAQSGEWAERYSKKLSLDQGFEDDQQAWAMAALHCDSKLKLRN